jgi:hypothetical protein
LPAGGDGHCRRARFGRGRRHLRMQFRHGPGNENFADFPLVETAFDLTASIERAVKQDLLRADQTMLGLDSLRSASHASHFISAIGGFITFGRKA